MSLAAGEGRVTARYGADFEIKTDENNIITATGRKKHREVVCGDYVRWKEESKDSFAIVEQLARNNALSRSGFRSQSKTLAANIDQLIIVTAAEPLPDWELTDQLLCVAEELETTALILQHKSDLLAGSEMLHEWEYFRKIGYEVLVTSVSKPESINKLEESLAHKTNILVGQSGVGKSSLAKVLLEDADIKIGDISAATQFGQHTTSVTRLYDLPLNGHLIDSPGVRDFAPDNLDQVAIHRGFIEIHALASECRFHNCQHVNEPECAIKAALDRGDINPRRYQSYIKLTGLN